jgi:signal transduction histidine kinase
MVAEIAPDLRAIGDEALLAIALTNILHNAVRFTPDGGGVNLRAERRLGSVVIEIQDSGIGIPEDQRGAIFEKFYEIGSTLSHSSGSLEFGSGGLGLGLPTAQNVLEALGGSLEVNSREGEGSTFRIVLKEGSSSIG